MALTMPVSEIVEKSQNPLLKVHPSWERVLLGDIAEVMNGYAFKSVLFSKEKGFPLIRIRDVKKGRTETLYDGPFDSNYIVNPGELIIGMDGDFNSSRWRGEPALLNQRVCKVSVTSPYYLPELLDYVLPGYLKEINEKTSSVTVKHLSSKTVKEIPLPFPPLNEQERIVAKIDELFTQLDAGVAELQKAKAQLKRYRQAVLKAAVKGELTREWRETHQHELEPASELLERILAERRTKWEEEELARMRAKGKEPKDNRWKNKYKEPIPVDMDGFSEIPSGWHWVNVGQVAEHRLGKMLDKAKNIGKPRPYLRNINVRWFSFDLSDIQYMLVQDEELNNVSVHVGDLVVCEGGEPGRAAVWINPKESMVIQKALHRVRAYKGVSPQFLAYRLAADASTGKLESYFTGSTIKHFTGQSLHTYVFPLPFELEQQQIISKVERRLTIADDIEQQLEQGLIRAERLRQSILKQAFEGKLVPQDLNDEPARFTLQKLKELN